MKVRAGFLASIIVIFTLALANCGGGGGSAVLNLIPEGDYYSIVGINVSQMVKSPFFKQYSDEVKWAEDIMKASEKEVKRMGIDIEQYTAVLRFLSTDAKENIIFHGGPKDASAFEKFCKRILNWNNVDEDDRNGTKYYVADDIDQAYLMAGGGAFVGNTNVIEDIIDVMTKGDKKLIDDKDYRERAALIDFSATQYMLQWDNLTQQRDTFKGYVRQVDDDEDLLDAVDDLEAWSYAVRWTNNLEFVLKFQFDNEKSVKTLGDFLEKEMDEFFKKLGEAQLRDFLRNKELTNLRDIDDLAKNAKVNRAGKVLEIRFAVNWDDIKNFID
jgi:hypothetical protein